MKWFERIFGAADYRQYGQNEYYEYPRNGSSGSWQREPELWHSSTESPLNSWRGPSIFEDSYVDVSPSGRESISYQETRHPSEDDRYSRDNSRYVHQYGGTIETSSGPKWRPQEIGHRYKESSSLDYGRDEFEESDGEELARAMHHMAPYETLSLQYPAPYGASTIAPPVVPPHFRPNIPAAPRSMGLSTGMSTCAGCNRTLGFGKFLTSLNRNWHPSCFKCGYCHKAIVDNQYSVQGSDPYHRNCYKEVFHPKCEICFNFIPPNAQGLVEYRSHPFWNQKYCPSHERDGTKRCCSCDRIEPVNARYQHLKDGRRLCSECYDSAVIDTKYCQPLYRDILQFYKNLGMPIEQEIPMLLVERAALNNALEVEKDGHTHAPETRGLCLSEEQTITTVLGNDSEVHGGHPAKHNTELRRLTRHCEVTAILVLYGLPRLLTGSILAHELMHAWLRLDGKFPTLENDIEEGICQVIAHIWLKAEIEKLVRRSRSGLSTNKRLGEFFLHQIETDASPIYGDGFRSAFASASIYGLARTLDHLRRTGGFIH